MKISNPQGIFPGSAFLGVISLGDVLGPWGKNHHWTDLSGFWSSTEPGPLCVMGTVCVGIISNVIHAGRSGCQ